MNPRDVPNEEITAATDAVFEETPLPAPEPSLPTPPSTEEHETPTIAPPSPATPDYLREIQQEFEEQEDESKWTL